MIFHDTTLINSDVLNEIMRIFYYSSLIPIKLIDSTLEIQGSFPQSNTLQYPISIDEKKDYKKIIDILSQSQTPKECFFYSNDFEFSYTSIGIWYNNTYKGSLIAGPFLLLPAHSLNMNNIIERHKMPLSIKPKLRQFYDSLTIVQPPRVLYLSKLLISLTQNKIDLSDISFIDNKKNEIQTNQTFSHYIIKNREKNLIRPPYVLVKDLYDYVKLGDLDNAKKIKKKLNEYEMIELPGVNSIRNAKNHLIIHCNSLLRAIIEGGVDLDFARTLGDSYTNYIENCINITDLIKISDKMLIEFVESVKRLGEAKINPAVQKSLKYIHLHLTEDLYLNQVAEKVNLHPKYFSSLFKKEMGIVFQNYISKSRIQEAKRLLDYSDNSILDIALQLGFKNQSYFTNTFKKHEGCTPNQYRKKKKQTQIL